jgi:methionyl-tRNA formyltransferase
MNGIVYIACTSVGRYIINSHLKNHPGIPIDGIINLDRIKSINKANYDSLYDIAYNNNIDILYCKNVNSENVLSFLKQKNPILIIQSGWSQKFGGEILSLPKYGCIGEHPAPIPKGRGAACVNWALIEDQKEWGDSFFKMVEEYDAGPVYAQKQFTIEEYDNVFTVYEKAGYAAYNIIKENLQQWYAGRFQALQIDESKATYYKKRTPKDGALDFSWNAKKIYNYVRALTRPYPGAFFNYEGKRVAAWEAVFPWGHSDKKSGAFFIDKPSQSLVVSTGDNKLIGLRRIQIEDMPEIYGHEFFNFIDS